MSDADLRRAEIIRFWRSVEMFSPPPVNKVSRQRRVYAVKPGEPLPWEPGHELRHVRLRRNQAWRHMVYVGIYPLEAVFEVMRRVLEPDSESFDERPGGESALAAFVVSDDGRPLIDSEVLSSCAWGVGRLLTPGPGAPGWLSGFDAARMAFNAEFEELVAEEEEGLQGHGNQLLQPRLGRPIGAEDLIECRDAAASAVGVGSALPHSEIRIASQIVAARNAQRADGNDFLNSFIADDLALVADQVKAGSVGGALREYLRPDAELDATLRIDVQQDLDTVLAVTAPAGVPLGRWPSAPGHPLALGQQLAVNSMLRLQEAGTGIFAVNGPPGTGKTTMLRDLIAALVVERARRLAELVRPGDAFTGALRRWKVGEYTRVVHEWKPQFTGFEMVLASANNGAVENVTNEIPAQDAIDAYWREAAAELDYFPGTASALLAVDRDDDEEPQFNEDSVRTPAPGWALVAARLGNKRNRSRFVDAFWYRKPAPRAADNDAVGSDLAEATGEDESQLGLLEILKRYEQVAPPRSWADETAEFRAALKRAESIQEDRERAYRDISRKVRLEQDRDAAQHALASAERQANVIRNRLAESERATGASQVEYELRAKLRAEHRQFRPGLWEWLTTLGKAMREWQRRDQELAAAVAAAEQAFGAARGALAQVAYDADVTARTVFQRVEAVRRCDQELAAVQAILDQAQAVLGRQFPDSGWRHDRLHRELAAPWTDPAWNQARSELFLAALRLHKAFLQHAPKQMRQSLHAAADLVSGEAPRDLPGETALAAWRSLFFVVPVVSTTFASFARLFAHLKQESLGWLLVDEAGQATPQNAVGALWRSKRAVVVGDPLQLEPITTLPFRAEQAIRRDHGVAEEWLSSRTSVQRLADRLTNLGTELPSDDGPIWVGAPLTVHRRCDQPMFGISNEIAYNGLMVNGTNPDNATRFAEKYRSLPASTWFDVVTTESQGHWIPAEGKHLDGLLAMLRNLDFDMSGVMVIGPFRDIARQIERRAGTSPGLVAGTIHTAQGKQADIVILVLGSDPQRDGALRWAAGKPNLLNVAASRAKHRLYVIGNRNAWSPHRHFSVLARRLPHTSPHER